MKTIKKTYPGQIILEKPITNTECIDVDKELFKQEYVKHYLNRDSGLFVILPNGEKLLNILSGLISRKIISKFNFKKIILPKISPLSTYKKANILGKWDSYLEKVMPFGKTKGIKEDYILEPLQCTPLYQLFENSRLDLNKLPLKFFDCSGPTYRNEDLGKLKALVKQREFHRAEFIYIGTKEQVIELRESILKEILKILESWGIGDRIVVGSGCFEVSKEEVIYPESIEEIPIKDIEVYIPKNKWWLELAGASVLWNLQTKRFNITSSEELWSGCVGIGLERLLYCFLAQKGFDIKNWPEEIQGEINNER